MQLILPSEYRHVDHGQGKQHETVPASRAKSLQARPHTTNQEEMLALSGSCRNSTCQRTSTDVRKGILCEKWMRTGGIFQGPIHIPSSRALKTMGVLSQKPLIDESEGMGWRFPSAIIRERAILSRDTRWLVLYPYTYRLLEDAKKATRNNRK